MLSFIKSGQIDRIAVLCPPSFAAHSLSVEYLLEEVLKGLFHPGVSHRTRFFKQKPFRPRELSALYCLNSPRLRTALTDVSLIAHQGDHYVLGGVLAQLIQPLADVVKALLVRDVVYEQRPHRSPVVSSRDGFVPLLARCVPDLGAYSAARQKGYSARRELYADGGGRVGGQGTFDVS